MHTMARKLIFFRLSQPIGNLIVIEKTGFGRVGLFLLGVLGSVPLVQPFKFVTETYHVEFERSFDGSVGRC